MSCWTTRGLRGLLWTLWLAFLLRAAHPHLICPLCPSFLGSSHEAPVLQLPSGTDLQLPGLGCGAGWGRSWAWGSATDSKADRWLCSLAAPRCSHPGFGMTSDVVVVAGSTAPRQLCSGAGLLTDGPFLP